MNHKKTLVVGASENENRYANVAIKKLLKNNIEVVAFGRRKGEVDNVKIETEKLLFENVHTVTMYVGAKNQEELYEYILRLKPSRVIFNPGTENLFFEEMLQKNNINVEVACTLVMLSLSNY